jgi:plastocyanin
MDSFRDELRVRHFHMNRLACLVIAWIGFCLPLARADCAIEGTVQLPPAAPILPMPARYQNKISGQLDPPEPPKAVVYLEGDFKTPGGTNSPPVKLEQRHFQFAPGLLPIQTGTAVEFPNLDDGYHNVFSYSKPKRFDLGRYRKDEKAPSLVFDKPGVIKLYCEIHDHMRGTILVLDTPYFVKTDAVGKFRLEHLPAGNYTLKAWLDEKTVRERPVELKDGSVLRVDFPGT